MTDEPSRESIEAWAGVLGLTLPAATVSGVQANFAQLARLLDDAPLDDQFDEPAATFVPR